MYIYTWNGWEIIHFRISGKTSPRHGIYGRVETLSFFVEYPENKTV